MATADARAYHHGDLRKTLLDTAVEHIAREGTEGLSLRALAREAGVSPTAPYRHFENRQALLAALATEGFRELGSRMETDPERLTLEPAVVFFEAGMTYVTYARENGVKYHLMFGDTIGDFTDHADLLEASQACYAHFEAMLQAGIDTGVLLQIPVRELGAVVWSMVHGVAGMLIAGDRKRAAGPEGHWRGIAAMEAQQQVVEAPGRVLLRLSRGIIVDADALTALEVRVGCPEAGEFARRQSSKRP